MPPSKGASTDPAATALDAESGLAGVTGAKGSVAADGAGWRETGRAARSSGSPNPIFVRWTGLTGVAPMAPTERASVGLEPSVEAGPLAEASLAARVAAGAGPELADDWTVPWLGTPGDVWRWTDGPAWRCATAGSAVCAGVAAGESVAAASVPPTLPTGAPRPARRDWPRVIRGAGAVSRATIGAAVLASDAGRAPGKNGTFGVGEAMLLSGLGAGVGLVEVAAALR